jgi:hypothetical protein
MPYPLLLRWRRHPGSGARDDHLLHGEPVISLTLRESLAGGVGWAPVAATVIVIDLGTDLGTDRGYAIAAAEPGISRVCHQQHAHLLRR